MAAPTKSAARRAPSSLLLALLLVLLNSCRRGATAPSAGTWQSREADGWEGCVLSLTVDSRATSVSFGGNAAAMGISGVVLTQANGTSPTLSGTIPLGITFSGQESGPDTDCAALLRSDAPVTRLHLLKPTQPGESPLKVSPSPVEIIASLGVASSLAQVFVENATVVFSDAATTSPLLPSDTPSVFRGGVVTTISSGTARVESAIGFLRTNATIASTDAPVNSTTVMGVTLTRTDTPQGTVVELEFPAYSAFFPVDIADGAAANVTITGKMVARGSLEVPSPPPSPPPPSSPPPPPPVLRPVIAPKETQGQCTGGEVWSSRASRCVCMDGLVGGDCSVCRTDEVCGAMTDSPDALCDTSFVYSSTTLTKSLACTADDPTIAQIVTSMGVKCSTSGSLPEMLQGMRVNRDLPFCEVDIGLNLGSPVDVHCSAFNCTIPLNGTTTDCKGVKCDCSGDCDAVMGIVDGLNTVRLECGTDSEQCDIKIKGLPMSNIPVSCIAGECIVPGKNTNFTGNAIEGSSADWERVKVATIAFIPTAFILFLLAIVLLFAKVIGGICAMGLSDGMPEPLRVKSLVFSGITVRVPQPQTASGKGRYHNARVSRRGDMQRVPGTAHGTPSQGSSPESDVVVEEGKQEVPALALPSGVAVGSTGKKRCILSGVSCSAQAGEVLAIMGPSGSGKTTLLSILGAREGDLGAAAKVKGEILVDGGKRRSSFKTRCGFVPQDDNLFPSLTVRETVKYSARLRLPGHSHAVINQLVEQTIDELRLSHVAGTRVGGQGSARGVSGGERRRVSIAMEMVTQPGMLMLDEPTSGLDSFAAASLMDSLRDIAAAGRIVVLTLHQPSPKAFMQLDRVLLLARGERMFYGAPSQVEAHFERAGFPCDHGIPVADHMLEVVSQEGMREAVARTAGEDTPPDCGTPSRELRDEESEGGGRGRAGRWRGATQAFVVELDVLLWRGAVNLLRNPALLLMHSLVALLMGVAMGFVFFGVSDDLSGQQNRAGGIFFTLAFFAFCSLSTVDMFLSERGIVFRETASGYYAPSSYLVVKLMLDSLLLRVLPALLYSLPFYFLMGLDPQPERIAVWFAVLSLFSATSGALSMMGSMGCPTAGVANLVMTLVLLVSLVFGGFLANLEAMPDWISWISWFSIFRYAFEALVVNEVTGSSFNLDVSGYNIDGLDASLILDVLGLDPDRFTLDVVILDALFAGFLLTAVIILYLKLPRHNRRTRASSCCLRRKPVPPSQPPLPVSMTATEMQGMGSKV